MKLTKLVLELIGWVQIVFASTAIGAMIGGVFYYFMSSQEGNIIAITLIILGFILGIVWATRIWIRTGTVEWLSRIRRIT
jgi:hypothetical protein